MALTKISNDGVKKPIDLEDDERVRFGTGNDLQIYHNGTKNVIKTMNGDIHLRYSGQDMVVAKPSAAVELYHNNSKKFETFANGVSVDGEIHIGSHLIMGDNDNIKLGAGSDLQIFHTNSDDTNRFYLSGKATTFWTGGSNNHTSIKITDGETPAVELYHDNDLRLQTWYDGVNIYGDEGEDARLHLYADDGDNNADKWRLQSLAASSTFELQNHTSGSWESNIKATGNGNVELYYDGGTAKFETTSTGAKITGEVEVTGKVKASNGYGSDGQVLTSKGGSANAEWADAGGGAWELLNSGSNTSAPADAGTIIDGLDSTYSAYKVIKIEFYIHFSNNTGYAGFQFKSGNSWNTANTYHSQCEYGRHTNSSHMAQDTNSNSSITINEDSNDRCENIAGTLSWYRGPNSEDAMLQWDAKGMAYSGANYDFFLFNGAGGNWDITNNQLQGIQWKNNTGSNVWWKVIGMK
tara:strand:+ start:3113 stop:4510 length:1398 start_codon:yes stop_codon:yes gene_type:complete